jgi:hypothetical protein
MEAASSVASPKSRIFTPRGARLWPRDQNVAGLQVAMNDALGVRGRQAICDLERVLHDLIHPGRSLEWLSLYVLHHQIIRPEMR